MKSRLNTISLFSGAGGLDVGFIKAGFNVLWSNDIDKDACETYRINLGSHIHCGDINQYVNGFFSEFDAYKDNTDIVIGGPPCQGFSIAGKMDPNDERSQNIWTFANIIDYVQPSVFVMENVKALATLEKWRDVRNMLIKRLENSGYMVELMVLNAKDYDVPQSRERAIFIGAKQKAFDNFYPKRDIVKYSHKSQTVGEVLRKLDKVGTGNNSTVCNAKITLASKPILRKSPYAGMLFNGMGRPIKIDGYCQTLPASMGGNKTPILDETSLRENVAPWIEQYHASLLRHDKNLPKQVPSRLRRITVEEAALIQTFPTGYVFCGKQSSQYKQIGNAVPCNLAYALARYVKSLFE